MLNFLPPELLLQKYEIFSAAIAACLLDFSLCFICLTSSTRKENDTSSIIYYLFIYISFSLLIYDSFIFTAGNQSQTTNEVKEQNQDVVLSTTYTTAGDFYMNQS